MINNKSVVALIPARGGSKGIPGKNIKILGGKPLIAWPIEAAKRSRLIDRVMVSTDDKKIADVAKSSGAEVPFLRPLELARDTSTTFSVIQHFFQFLNAKGENYDYLVLLEPTSPLTTSEDIDKALTMLIQKREIADSIVGASKVEATHPNYCVRINDQGLMEPYKGEFSKPTRRQEIDEIFFKEGSLYISDVSALLSKKGFYHNRTLPYIVPKWKAFEIDDPVDLICVEAILQKKTELERV